MNKEQLLHIALVAALEAGKEILKIYRSDDFGVEIKGDKSPLTKADMASHQVISKYLDQTNIQVLSEEGKGIAYETRKDWKQLWIIDPIDGTKEFIKRNDEFTVNIALVENQKPTLGVVYAPATGELYFAEESMGAFKTTFTEPFNLEEILKTGKRLPIKSDRIVHTVVASKSHLSPETEEYIESLKTEYGKVDVISRGSSLKLCMVAEGLADCYPRFAPTMEWDTAAGQAICSFAGKVVLDWSTKQAMLYNREVLLNNWFLVS